MGWLSEKEVKFVLNFDEGLTISDFHMKINTTYCYAHKIKNNLVKRGFLVERKSIKVGKGHKLKKYYSWTESGKNLFYVTKRAWNVWNDL